MVLTRYLRFKLVDLNPGLPQSAYDDAVRQITAAIVTQTLLATNREKYTLFKDGIQVTFRNDKGERVRQRLRFKVDPMSRPILLFFKLHFRSYLGTKMYPSFFLTSHSLL